MVAGRAGWRAHSRLRRTGPPPTQEYQKLRLYVTKNGNFNQFELHFQVLMDVLAQTHKNVFLMTIRLHIMTNAVNRDIPKGLLTFSCPCVISQDRISINLLFS